MRPPWTGCSPRRALFKVVLPEILPGVITGFLMAFTFSLDDFVISYFTHGATAQPLSVQIFSMTRRKVSRRSTPCPPSSLSWCWQCC